jgi:hypothetical protein
VLAVWFSWLSPVCADSCLSEYEQSLCQQYKLLILSEIGATVSNYAGITTAYSARENYTCPDFRHSRPGLCLHWRGGTIHATLAVAIPISPLTMP